MHARTRRHVGPRVVHVLSTRVTALLAVLLTVVLTATLLPRSAATASVPVRRDDTQDGYYCLYARHMSGLHYYQYKSTHYEWIPVGEIHTAGNVHGRFAQGQEMSTTLSGGVTLNAGKTWTIGVEASRTKSYKVDVQMATLPGGSHKRVLAKFKYKEYRLVCYNKDPRTGLVSARDYTPKYIYTPTAWTTDLKYGAASTSTPSCRTGRSSVPENKLYLPHGTTKSIVQGTSYTVSVTLSGIGVSGRFSSSSGTSRAFSFWTSSGSSYICGNKSSLSGSTKFYANRK